MEKREAVFLERKATRLPVFLQTVEWDKIGSYISSTVLPPCLGTHCCLAKKGNFFPPANLTDPAHST